MSTILEQKSALYTAIARCNRGVLATEMEQATILTRISALEDCNPTPRPTETPELLDGDWQLLYTTSKGILSVDRIPGLKLGQVYQCIRVSESRLFNIAEVYGLPYLEGINSVSARFQIVSERRVTVKFERLLLGLQRLMDYRSPVDFVHQLEQNQQFPALNFNLENRDQQGWLDTTYLDADLRIGRGNEGSVFVLSRTV
jgi:PAP_fibrillin